MNKLDGDLKLVKGYVKFLQNFVVFIYFCNEYNSEECFVSFWEIIFRGGCIIMGNRDYLYWNCYWKCLILMYLVINFVFVCF